MRKSVPSDAQCKHNQQGFGIPKGLVAIKVEIKLFFSGFFFFF